MIVRKQIKYLFSHPKEAMRSGLWFSGVEKEGEFKLWWNNGNLRMHYFYKDGREHGPYKEWNRSGKLRAYGTYNEGEIVEEFLI